MFVLYPTAFNFSGRNVKSEGAHSGEVHWMTSCCEQNITYYHEMYFLNVELIDRDIGLTMVPILLTWEGWDYSNG